MPQNIIFRQFLRISIYKMIIFQNCNYQSYSLLHSIIKLQDHWVWQDYLNVSMFLRIEVAKHICSLLRIFKIAYQTQQSRDLKTEYKRLHMPLDSISYSGCGEALRNSLAAINTNSKTVSLRLL